MKIKTYVVECKICKEIFRVESPCKMKKKGSTSVIIVDNNWLKLNSDYWKRE